MKIYGRGHNSRPGQQQNRVLLFPSVRELPRGNSNETKTTKQPKVWKRQKAKKDCQRFNELLKQNSCWWAFALLL